MNDATPTNEHESHEDSDDTAIEAKGVWGSIRIPLSRADIGPHVRWLVFAIALSVVMLALGGAIALVKWSL